MLQNGYKKICKDPATQEIIANLKNHPTLIQTVSDEINGKENSLNLLMPQKIWMIRSVGESYVFPLKNNGVHYFQPRSYPERINIILICHLS